MMLALEKRWTKINACNETIKKLSSQLKINPIICSILVQRGIATFEEAKRFFRPSLDYLHSPWLMKDMHKAVDRIIEAIQQKQKILIYGDYDVDGTTSVSSMYMFLSKLSQHVSFYIPHRYKEGYGVSKAGIDFAIEHNFDLIITLDCGIKSIDLITYANSKGIEVIICDHHLPDDDLPPAYAILNPKQKDCSYPFKELCGCGVGFKLMQAVSEKLDLTEETYLKYLDLVATAIAADIVPIIDENRILMYFGLKRINSNPCAGIKALMDLSSVQTEMVVSSLVFVIAPRINAAGRMDDAAKAVNLFIQEDYDKAIELAKQLHVDNTERKEADSTITQEAFEMLCNDCDTSKRKTTVVYKESWHKGVVGIVASRLIDTYYKPTIVLTKSGEHIAGSARSVTGFNLYEAIHACKDYLINYGGHYAAAGLTLHPSNLERFKQKFEEVVSQTIDEQLLFPEIKIDASIHFENITPSFYQIIHQMEPFGPENMRPVFLSKNVFDTGYSKIVKEKHVRFCVKQGRFSFTGIGFNLADKYAEWDKKTPIDLVYTLELNEWNNQQNIQLKILDFKPSDFAN